MADDGVITISFRDAYQFVLRGIIPALLVGAAAAAAAYLVSRSTEPFFRATSILLATRPGSASVYEVNVVEPNQLDPDIYRSAVMQGGLLERALEDALGSGLGHKELADWRQRVRVRADDNLISGLLRLEVDDPDPQLAQRVSNALATSLLAWDRERVLRNLQTNIAFLRQAIALLETQIASAEGDGLQEDAEALRATYDQRVAQLRTSEVMSLSTVVLGLLEPFRDASISSGPVNDRTAFVSVVAFTLFFLLSYIVLFLAHMIDPRIKTADDVQAFGGLLETIELPRPSEVTRYEDAIDDLATHLQLSFSRITSNPSSSVKGGSALVVISPAQDLAEPSIAIHIATTYAEAGLQVLLVDADLKTGALSKAFAESQPKGKLTTLLRVGEPDIGSRRNSSGPSNHLDFIAAGDVPSSIAAVSLARAAKSLIDEWRALYEIVIIYGGSLSTAYGALSLVQAADAVLVSLAKNRTLLREVRSTAAVVAEYSSAPIIAVVKTSWERRKDLVKKRRRRLD